MSRVDYWLSVSFDDLKDVGIKAKRIRLEQDYTCLLCKRKYWTDGIPIPLETDHIDGNNGNWDRDNVRAICPNCHALTDNYRGRNINSGKIKVSDQELIDALDSTNSISQALLQCKLSAKGSNYDRVKRLLNR